MAALALATGLLALAPVWFGGVATSQEATDTSITVLAGVPDEAVDVVIDGEPQAGSLAYGDVSDPVAVEPGRHEVMLGPRGGPDEEPDRIAVELAPGDHVTVARFLDRTGEAQIEAFPADRSPVPADQARFVFRNIAELPEVDVRLNREPVGTDLRSGRTATQEVAPAADARMDVVLAGTGDEVIEPARFDVPAGQLTVASVVGSAREDNLRVVVEHIAAMTPGAPSSTTTEAPPTTQAPPTEPVRVTVVQALLGTEVDVWVDGDRAIGGLDATRLAAGLELAVGRHEVAFRLAGDPPDARPLAERDVEVEEGVPQSVVVHLDDEGKPTVTTFRDPIPGGVEPGAALLTVRHVGLGGPVDVQLGEQEIADDLEPGREAATEVPAGAGAVDVRFVEGDASIPAVAVQLEEGTSSVLYIAGSPEDGSATVLMQATGRRAPAPRTVPTGIPAVPGSGTPLLWAAAVLGLTAPVASRRIRSYLAAR